MLMSLNVAVSYADDWMGRLPDNVYLHQLSIPGTHDSGTGEGLMDGFATMGKTQDLGISEQWACGIRAFDLRPAVKGKQLQICHGIITTNITFDKALHIIADSLDKHPTEMAVVIVRHESEYDNNADDTWNELMKELLSEDWLAEKLIGFDGALTLGNARGKIVLLSRNAYDSTPHGGFVSGWGFSENFAEQRGGRITGPDNKQTTLYVQDFYDCSEDNGLETKKRAITAMLDFSVTRATTSSRQAIWVINHTSGYSLVMNLFGTKISTSDGYRDNAASSNEVVIDYLNDIQQPGPTGMVMMDFAGVDTSDSDERGKPAFEVKGLSLTRAIVENNFLYDMKNDGTPVWSVYACDTKQPTTVYTISGEMIGSYEDTGRLQQLPKGIYIMKQNGKTQKIAIQ